MPLKSKNFTKDTARKPDEFMRLFDSHSHINAEEFDADRSDVIARMREAGLEGALVVGCDYGEEQKLFSIIDSAPGFLFGAWALHPEYEDRPECSVEEIVAVCSDKRICAVGETGLDYYWCKGDLAWQKERFVRHIEAAKKLGKPLVVHARQAESDALDILAEHDAGDVGFVMHCFGGDLQQAKRAIDLGGLVSFTGVLTFKNAAGLRDIAAALPLNKLMVETDCPYMAPVPYRGKRCEPAYVSEVARTLALVHGVDAETAAAVTTDTAKSFFGIH